MGGQMDPKSVDVVIASATVMNEDEVVAEAGVAVEGSSALLVARFADQISAGDAYEALLEAEVERDLCIDGVLVVDADADGKVHIRKMTDHHTKRGTLWGAVAGGALALIFPPSILAGAIAGGVIGAAVGKVGNVMTRGQVASELATVITPGSSGIVALLDLSEIEAVTASIPAATEVKTVPVDAATADAVKEAATMAAGDEPARG
jgi:uncharacterized membrane protein